LKFTPKQYQVKASLLLKNEEPNSMSSEQFLKGMELFTPKTELEDEIGILKSYTIIKQAIRELDFGVSYYTRKNFVTRERYSDTPFTIQLDSVVDQLIYLPIYIERLTSTTFKVTASGKEIGIYNPYTDKSEAVIEKVDVAEVGSVDKPIKNTNLSFTIKFNDQFRPDNATEMFFVITPLNALVEDYQNKLKIEQGVEGADRDDHLIVAAPSGQGREQPRLAGVETGHEERRAPLGIAAGFAVHVERARGAAGEGTANQASEIGLRLDGHHPASGADRPGGHERKSSVVRPDVDERVAGGQQAFEGAPVRVAG
jgi:hypothetical protein